MSFGKNLQYLRQLSKNMTQETLAEKLNVSRQTVSKWEVGESTPDMEKLVAISALFEISLDELVLDKVPEQPGQPVQVAGSGIYNDIKEHVLTDDNRKKAKKGLKIAGIIVGAILLVDIISFIIYVIMYGLPQ